jgi:MFS family permease
MDNSLRGRRAAFFVTMLLAAFPTMYVISAAGVYVASAVAELDGMKYIGLIFTLESLARSVALPMAGKLGDRYGRKNLFIVGVAGYVGATLLCACAGGVGVFLAGRTIMGATWGLFFANMFVMVNDVYGRERSPRVTGHLQAVNMAAMVVAAPLTGVICEFASWRVVFFASVPFLVVSALLALKCVPGGQHRIVVPIDVKGVVLTAVALTPFSLALSMGGVTFGWRSLPIVGMLVVAVAAVVLLVFVERKAVSPIFPGHMFRDRNFMILFTLAILYSFVSASSNYLPVYAQIVLGTGITVSAFIATPGMILGVLAAPFVGARISNPGMFKPLIIRWVVLVTVACVMGIFFSSSTPIWFIVLAFGIVCTARAHCQILPIAYPQVKMAPALIATAVAFINFGGAIANTIGNAIFSTVINNGIENVYKVPIAFAIPMVALMIIFKDDKSAGDRV